MMCVCMMCVNKCSSTKKKTSPCIRYPTDLHLHDLSGHATVEVDEDDAAPGARLADVVTDDVRAGVQTRVDTVVDHAGVSVSHLWKKRRDSHVETMPALVERQFNDARSIGPLNRVFIF